MRTFDRTICRKLSTRLVEELNNFAKKNNLIIAPAGGSFTDAEYTTKLRVTFAGEEGKEAVKAKWAQYCGMLGLKKSHLGKTFLYQGDEYTIAGISPNRRKFPIQAKNAMGKIYLFPASAVGGPKEEN